MPITLPSNVAPNELIQSAWGNSVVDALDELDDEKLDLAGDTMSGTLQIGGDGTTQAGTLEFIDGRLYSYVTSPNVAATASLSLTRAAGATSGGPGDTGGHFINFLRTAAASGAGTIIGSILLDSAASVAYATTSDYRLKNILGEVHDPLGVIARLHPRRLAWKEGGGEFDGFFAHEVAEVVPGAVYGEKDATNDDGTIDPQQFDAAALVPILVAAIQQLSTRIELLEGGG